MTAAHAAADAAPATPRPPGTADVDGRDAPPSISAVVFDLGGVLVDWDPTYVLTPADVATLDIDGVQRELDLGTPVEEVRARWRSRYPAHADTVDHYLDTWDRTVAGPLDATVEVFDELRGTQIGLYALSNFSGDLFRRNRPKLPFVEGFDGLVISGDEGIIKPDPAIYELLLDRFALNAGATVFVDDRGENVVAAYDAGLIGIRFRSAQHLRGELCGLGVL